MRLRNKSTDWDKWKRDGIKSKSTGLIIAPEDYAKRDKKQFTWSEAMAIEKNAPDGWRLPTIAEWGHILAEFGENENGELDATSLKDKLKLKLDGWYDFDDKKSHNQGVYGYYWSRTSHSSNNDYAMYFYFVGTSGWFNLQYNRYKYNGFSVRCVLDAKGGSDETKK